MDGKVYRSIEDGFFRLEDLESSICTGHVRKTERDELKQSIGNRKYVIIGLDMEGYDFYSVGKIMTAEGSKFYYVITAHCTGVDYDELRLPGMRKR